MQTKTQNSKSTGLTESLVLDNSEKGATIAGFSDDTIAAKTGKIKAKLSFVFVWCFRKFNQYSGKNDLRLFLLVPGDKIVAATIQLDKLEKNDVLKILKVLEPYESNINLLTNKDVRAGVDLGSLGVRLKDSAEVNTKL